MAALHPAVRTGIALPHRVPAPDPIVDFPRESPFVSVDSHGFEATTTSSYATAVPPHAIDTTSRVISFVLGFALASLVAWLGSIRDELPVMPIEDRVVPAVTPVVTATTEEKTFTTTEHPRPAVSGDHGALALSSSPEGSEVVLNGKVVGATPVVLSDLPVGSHALVMRRHGYSPWSASVQIVANQRTNLSATLVPVRRTGG
jgi:hypothetical protein